MNEYWECMGNPLTDTWWCGEHHPRKKDALKHKDQIEKVTKRFKPRLPIILMHVAEEQVKERGEGKLFKMASPNWGEGMHTYSHFHLVDAKGKDKQCLGPGTGEGLVRVVDRPYIHQAKGGWCEHGETNPNVGYCLSAIKAECQKDQGGRLVKFVPGIASNLGA